MTTIKIPDDVHLELKVFVAAKKESMSEFAGIAIMKELINRQHNFIVNKLKKQNPKIKK